MGSSPLLRGSSALWLLVLASASLDSPDHTGHMMEQREVTFDLKTLMQEMEKPDLHLMQTEMDLSELLDPEDFRTDPKRENHDGLRVRNPAAPRSIPPPYHVHFPLARPSSDNLQAICSHSAHRPRYPQTYLPSSGYGQLRRRAAAVNNAEFWFSDCCQQNATLGSEATLCCATQAWEHHIKLFCEEDSSVKDRLYKCCRKRGGQRHDCFHDDAPNPNYDPTEEQPVTPVASKTEFSFDPSTCPRSVVTPHSFREHSNNKKKDKRNKQPPSPQNIRNFPLGRPTPDNIEALCQNKKLRPLYSVKCLAGRQHKLLAQQAKSINRMERGFKVCCKNKQEVLNCAEQKWREEVDMFCEKLRRKKQTVHCCSLAPHHRFECFQDASPDPHYQMFSAKEELALNKLCEDHKLLKKKLPDALPLKAFVNQCCPLPEQNKTDCFEQRITEISGRVCSSKKKTSPAVSRCCRAASEDVPGCLSELFMHVVNKVAHIKKKKTCPLQNLVAN